MDSDVKTRNVKGCDILKDGSDISQPEKYRKIQYSKTNFTKSMGKSKADLKGFQKLPLGRIIKLLRRKRRSTFRSFFGTKIWT